MTSDPVDAVRPATGVQDRYTRIAAVVASYPALPVDDGSLRHARRLTVSWLLTARSANTERAHCHDLKVFLLWCQQRQVDPLTARPSDLHDFRDWRSLRGSGNRCAKDTTVARALASLSSWYAYLVRVSDGAVARNPVASTPRPRVDSLVAGSVGCSLDEVDALLAAADAHAMESTRQWLASPTPFRLQRRMAALRDRALLWLLADLGLRIGEALHRDIADVTTAGGRRILRYPGSDTTTRERVLPARTIVALDDYLAARAAAAGIEVGQLTGLLFPSFHHDGATGRVKQHNVLMTVRRLAERAGIAAAGTMSPHTLRHTFAATARRAGISLLDLQEAMGHTDPRTTRRYIPIDYRADQDPAHVLSGRRRSAATAHPVVIPGGLGPGPHGAGVTRDGGSR